VWTGFDGFNPKSKIQNHKSSDCRFWIAAFVRGKNAADRKSQIANRSPPAAVSRPSFRRRSRVYALSKSDVPAPEARLSHHTGRNHGSSSPSGGIH
jgi:hypothetical protein